MNKDKDEFWSGKNVLITGADGFVGSNLARALFKKGSNVTAILEKPNPQGGLVLQGIINKVKVIEGDISDSLLMDNIIREESIDSCFHLATQAIVHAASQSPVSTFKSNIEGTWVLLEACRNNSVLRIVVASSDKAYGSHDKLPYTEDFCLKPTFVYESSKACADILARTYAASFNMPVAVTRCANIYGSGDMNMSRIIPDSVLSVLKGRNPVIRSDGSPIRDYVYIDDVVDAYLLLAERLSDSAVKGQAFNFGRNEPISVLELVNKIIKLSGKSNIKPDIQGKGNPHGEIDKQYLSSKKAKSILGWCPKHDLNSGLEKTIEWYRRLIR